MTFLAPTGARQKKQFVEVSKGQTIAVINRPEEDNMQIVRVMPEDVDELVHGLRRADKLKQFSAMDIVAHYTYKKVRKISRKASLGFACAKQDEKKQREK